MRHTLSDTRALVKQFVDSGSCRNEVIDARINEALERLMDAGDWECLRRLIRLNVLNQTFVLPPEVEKILWVDTNGVPGKLFGQPYQFMSSGVGDLDYRGNCYGSGFRDVVDLGDHWSVMYAIPASAGNLPLVAVSSDATDVGVPITARCRDAAHTVMDLALTVQGIPAGVAALDWYGNWEADGLLDAGLTVPTDLVSHVDQLVKPVSAGTITLLAVDEENEVYYKLATYYPATTHPQFRRYRLTNFHPDTTVTTDDETCAGSTDVLALVRLRFVPLVNATDELPIDSIQALKLMVMAIREENAGNLQGALNYSAQAIKVLSDREKSRIMSDGMPTILNVDYRASTGRALNRGGLIL